MTQREPERTQARFSALTSIYILDTSLVFFVIIRISTSILGDIMVNKRKTIWPPSCYTLAMYIFLPTYKQCIQSTMNIWSIQWGLVFNDCFDSPLNRNFSQFWGKVCILNSHHCVGDFFFLLTVFYIFYSVISLDFGFEEKQCSRHSLLISW